MHGMSVFKADHQRLFHPLFLDELQRQTDRRFFNVLNKIRFSNIDKEVKEALAERFAAYNPSTELWNTTFLASLRSEARLLNQTVLDSILTNDDTFVSVVNDYQNNQLVETAEDSTIFKNGTNIPRTVVYTLSAKVIFLTNTVLVIKGISNRSVGVIISVNLNGKVEAVFLTKNRIEVSASDITLI